MADEKVQQLLNVLKGLPEGAIEAVVNQAQQMATRLKQHQEQMARLEAAKNQIADAIKKLNIGVDNFDVQKRGDTITVKIVGVGTGSRGSNSPKSTPIRDSGMSMRELVQKYLPDKMAEFEQGDSNKKYALAKQALKVKMSQGA